MIRKRIQQLIHQFRQNTFFTFLNLFGISITIMVIMVGTIQVDNKFNPGGPESNNDKHLYLTRMKYKNDDNGVMIGGLNLEIIENYLLKTKSAKATAFTAKQPWNHIDPYDVKEYTVRYTNAGFWTVYDFRFIAGKGYTKEDVEASLPYVVISESISRKFFNSPHEAVGKTIVIFDKNYTVTGVTKDVSPTCTFSHAQAWMPYTLRSNIWESIENTGAYEVTFYVEDKNQAAMLKEEANNIEQQVSQQLSDWTVVFGGPYTALDNYFQGYGDPERYDGSTLNVLSLLFNAFLVMLIPAINLVSLNLTRMHERSEEIAIRKSFGASRGRLIRQLLTENGILSVAGALLGFGLAILVTAMFKEKIFLSPWDTVSGEIQFRVQGLSILICIVMTFILNLLSGLIPALKLSKLAPAKILKGGEL